MKNDNEIQKEVISQLKWEPFVKASEIGVSVKDGIVTLSGIVDSYSKKIAAETAVKKVSGVRAIAEDIQIGVSLSYMKTDTEIAESVLNSLKWHTAIPDEKIQVKVEEGVVTLDGEVEWEYQRGSARNVVNNLAGVKNVISNLMVKPKIAESDIKNKIKSAFHRTATIDAGKVEVEVNGSSVILRGEVRSFVEKEDAESAAWSAPGVTTVESYLHLVPEEEFTF
ncbi:MAG: BON domain-containing protein [Flavisolibacter sp.]